jgi:hypothetical protein
MKFLKFIGWTLLILIVLIVIFIVTIGILSSSDDTLEIITEKNSALRLDKTELHFLSFPLSPDTNQNDLSSLLSDAERINHTDFILFQNVDENNNGFDEKVFLNNLFDSYNSWFSYTKKTLISLFPLDNIRFNLYSGSMTFSKYAAESSVKRLLPSVVNQTFSLTTSNPSLQILEFNTENNSELFIINLENIPINKTATAREDFLNYLKEDLINKLPEDAYVIISGNWFYTLPGILTEKTDAEKIPLDWTPSGWQWVYDINGNDTYGILISDNMTIQAMKAFDGLTTKPLSVVLSLK